MAKERDYKREYEQYHGKPSQIRNRAKRNGARALMIKKRGKAAVAGKDVDHKRHLAKGGGNGMGNLRIRSVHANRSDNH
jgi:hypothetical protein